MIHPGHVHDLRAQLAPAFGALFGRRLEGAHEHDRRALLVAWEDWRERPPRAHDAAELLDHGHELAAWLGQVLEAPRARTFATGLTVPNEVTSYHRLWDEYVRGAAEACQKCAQRLTDGKAYEFRAKALAAGWNAADDLSSSEQLLTGGDLLKLYEHTVHLAREDLELVKREFPDVPRPALPTKFVQAAVIGDLEAAGLIARGSMEIVADTATEIAATVKKTATSPLLWFGLGIAGVFVLRGIAK